jgi:hypothetical protein
MYQQPVAGLRTFLHLLIIEVGHKSIPRISHDCKLIVTYENLRLQLFRVTRNVLVTLPLRLKESLHAFATRFRYMNKDAAILVVNHRLIFL